MLPPPVPPDRPPPASASGVFVFAAFRPVRVALLLMALSGGGCRTPTQEHPSSHETAQRISDHLVYLRVGMHQPQALKLLGEPDEMRPADPANEMRETWIYRLEYAPTYRTVVVDMVEVPWVDPITGELKMLKEPLPSQQRIQILETVRLSFLGPRLTDIRRDTVQTDTYMR